VIAVALIVFAVYAWYEARHYPLLGAAWL